MAKYELIMQVLTYYSQTHKILLLVRTYVVAFPCLQVNTRGQRLRRFSKVTSMPAATFTQRMSFTFCERDLLSQT
jgi:hypothetical protein